MTEEEEYVQLYAPVRLAPSSTPVMRPVTPPLTTQQAKALIKTREKAVEKARREQEEKKEYVQILMPTRTGSGTPVLRPSIPIPKTKVASFLQRYGYTVKTKQETEAPTVKPSPTPTDYSAYLQQVSSEARRKETLSSLATVPVQPPTQRPITIGRLSPYPQPYEYAGYVESIATPVRIEAGSKRFYEKIGFPQFGGKYEPFTVPEGFKVKEVTETEKGLQVKFESTAGPSITEQLYKAITPSPSPLQLPSLILMPGKEASAGKIAVGLVGAAETMFYGVGSLVGGAKKTLQTGKPQLAYGWEWAGLKTPRLPPTGFGVAISSGVQSVLAGKPVKSEEWKQLEEWGVPYAFGTVVGDIFLSWAVGKGVEKLIIQPLKTTRIGTEIGYQFKQHAPEPLLKLYYGKQMGKAIAIEREWGWTPTYSELLTGKTELASLSKFSQEISEETSWIRFREMPFLRAETLAYSVPTKEWAGIRYLEWLAPYKRVEQTFMWTSKAWGLSGWTQTLTREAFETQQSLSMRMPVKPKPEKWYIQTHGYTRTPMEVTLKKAEGLLSAPQQIAITMYKPELFVTPSPLTFYEASVRIYGKKAALSTFYKGTPQLTFPTKQFSVATMAAFALKTTPIKQQAQQLHRTLPKISIIHEKFETERLLYKEPLKYKGSIFPTLRLEPVRLSEQKKREKVISIPFLMEAQVVQQSQKQSVKQIQKQVVKQIQKQVTEQITITTPTFFKEKAIPKQFKFPPIPFLIPKGKGKRKKLGLFGAWFKREHKIKTPEEMVETFFPKRKRRKVKKGGVFSWF